MSGMVNDNGFLEDDFQQNLDSLRLQKKAEEVVDDLDQYVQEEYSGSVEAALLTRSGHYGMSLMADSALMQKKFDYDPEAQEAADLDLCIAVSDDVQQEVTEIRELFKREDGSYGELNQKYEGVEINPRIIHKGGLIGKLEKAAEEIHMDIPENVNFPNVDGTETNRSPEEFLGYFHQGYTPIIESEEVEETLDYVSNIITDQDGEVYEEIWDEVWDCFPGRIEFKSEAMDRNAEIGKVEMAKTNAERLDYSRENYVDEDTGAVKLEDRELEETGMAQMLKDELEDEGVLEWFEGEHPGEIGPEEHGQQRLDLKEGPEPEAKPEKEVIRRKVTGFLEDHPDIERAARSGEYEFTFGPELMTEYFGEDFEYDIAEGAAKSALGRQLSSQESGEDDSGENAELSDF